MPTECSHDPTIAQRHCLCDPACICRVAGSCPNTSGDATPALTRLGEAVAALAGSEGAEVMMYGVEIKLPREEPINLLGGPSLAKLHQRWADRAAIEVVPKERLRAELTAWQDEWPGIEQLADAPEK